jgi:zinc finger SWIM domain-containing protein 3
MISIGDEFTSIEEARRAIRESIIDDGESYAFLKSDQKRFIIICKAVGCKFRIRASKTKKGVKITIKTLHTCIPATHYNSRPAHSIWYLKDHHRASVIDNRDIIPAQIQSDERLRFSNSISYQQAWRVKQALLEEIERLEADCFAQFPVYLQRLSDADQHNMSQIKWDKETGAFLAVCVAPSATISASYRLRRFFAIDACHTKSQFPMMLMIVCSIDANNNVLPLLWALVPTENEEWWIWFLSFLASCFKVMNEEDCIFISDRDKGITAAISSQFPTALPAHCCQHIADNIQQQYGVKCRLLFWKCVWAKTTMEFQEAL